MEHGLGQMPIVGFSLILALIAGKLTKRLQIPKVSGYILVGILLGPTLLNIITEEAADQLSTLNELAFGIILFNIGGEFNKALFKKMTSIHLKYSFVFGTLVFITTALFCFAFSLLADLTWIDRIVISSLLGVVATAAAPPTSILVMKELESEGHLTQTVTIFLALGTIMAITVSHIFTLGFIDLHIWTGTQTPMLEQILAIIWTLIGSLLLGSILGITLGHWEQREKHESEILLGLIAVIILGSFIAKKLGLEPLLVSMFMGLALVNSSATGKFVHQQVKNSGSTIYALFFVLAGAHINLREQFSTLGILGLGYIISRTLSMPLSAILSCRFIKDEDNRVTRFLGISTLSHAGAALAIVMKIKAYPESSAQTVANVVLSSIFFFEILGPISLRYAILKSGEAGLANRITCVGLKGTVTYLEMIKTLMRNLKILPSIEQTKGGLNSLGIAELVNHKVMAVNEKATLEEILRFILNNDLVIYPVVDTQFNYIGILDLEAIDNIKNDDILRRLTTADKLLSSKISLKENMQINEALEIFNRHGQEVLPVTATAGNKLIGTLQYRLLLNK